MGAVGTVAYSRMYLDAHWLSDVVGGFTAGLAYLLLAIWVVRSAPRWRRILGVARLPATPDVPLIPATAGSAPDPLVAVAAAAIPPATAPRDAG